MSELTPLSPLPPPEADKASQIADIASELGSMTQEGIPGLGISKELAALMARGLHSAKLPKSLRNQRAAEAFQDAFDIIGGTVRLALWADQNPDKFFAIFGRQIAATMAPVLDKLPQDKQADPSQQWPEWLTSRRLAYQEKDQVIDDVKVKTTTGEGRDGG